MGLLGGIVKIVGILILAVIGLAAFLYFTDYEAEATVTEKGRDAEGDFVIIRPRVIPMDIRKDLDASAAQFVCEGYQVTYRVQSSAYSVRDEQGRVVYDSRTGLTDTFAPLRCGVLGA